MSVALKLNPDSASVSAGYVERCEGKTVVVRADGLTLRAKRAPSCLLEPESRDRVLVATTGEGSSFVLAVLERTEGATHKWTAEGDVSIESPTGRVDVVAPQGASIATKGDISLRGRALDVRSAIASFAVGKLSLLGEEVIAEVSRSRLVSSTIESLAETVTQTASRVMRIVTQIDQLRAGTVDIAAEKALMIHAENAVITAKDLVKMDGEAVQLG